MLSLSLGLSFSLAQNPTLPLSLSLSLWLNSISLSRSLSRFPFPSLSLSIDLPIAQNTTLSLSLSPLSPPPLSLFLYVYLLSRGENALGFLDQGGWEKDETVYQAAAREALEEAGIIGTIHVSSLFEQICRPKNQALTWIICLFTIIKIPQQGRIVIFRDWNCRRRSWGPGSRGARAAR